MIQWTRGSWTGSINKLVNNEVKQHFQNNAASLNNRYPFFLRLLHIILIKRSFIDFLAIYIFIALAVATFEIYVARHFPGAVLMWKAVVPPGPDNSAVLLTLAGHLITAQVGALGVIAIAIGLVTLIAQHDGSSTDVKIYYHESMSIEVVTSSIALLVALCLQLLWPIEFVMNYAGSGFGSDSYLIKLILFSIHSFWLIVNLAALAHFITTTFGFVQLSRREILRQRYTANVMLPWELTRQLRISLYLKASNDLTGEDNDDDAPTAFFGVDYGHPYEVELENIFPKPTQLYDVRMVWVNWVLRRWMERCRQLALTEGSIRSGFGGPLIWFTPNIGDPLQGQVSWCRRRGGAPLTRLERAVLRMAFRFRRSANEN